MQPVVAYAGLDRDEVRAILSLYHLEGPDDFGGCTGGRCAYWVRTGERKFVLRVSDNKGIDEMIFEKEVLGHLERHELPVPRLVRNVAQGTFTPWSTRGRYVSLFEFMPGRVLGLFEVRPRHLRAVGQVLARTHRALGSFPRRRAHAHDLRGVLRVLGRLQNGYDKRRIARRFGRDLDVLDHTLQLLREAPWSEALMGTVHGNPELESFRFVDHKVVGLCNFEQAISERWTWDLAAAIHAWCWVPSAEQQGGPAGTYDPDRVRSLLRAYHRMRPLTPGERAVLPHELRLAAARQAVHSLYESELRRRGAYRDYRQHTARLCALEVPKAEELVQLSLR